MNRNYILCYFQRFDPVLLFTYSLYSTLESCAFTWPLRSWHSLTYIFLLSSFTLLPPFFSKQWPYHVITFSYFGTSTLLINLLDFIYIEVWFFHISNLSLEWLDFVNLELLSFSCHDFIFQLQLYMYKTWTLLFVVLFAIVGYLDPHIFFVLPLCNLILIFITWSIPFIPSFVKSMRLDKVFRAINNVLAYC